MTKQEFVKRALEIDARHFGPETAAPNPCGVDDPNCSAGDEFDDLVTEFFDSPDAAGFVESGQIIYDMHFSEDSACQRNDQYREICIGPKVLSTLIDDCIRMWGE